MFINRENELKKLNSLFALKKGSIVVCKGRRRIGKSRLIEEFGKSAKHYIEIQGLSPYDGITKKDQLSVFSRQPNRWKIENDIYEQIEVEHLPEWNTIMGFQFENLVLNNRKTLCKAIGINLSTIKSAALFFKNKQK